MSDAYVIGHITVKDADRWSEYAGRVSATLVPWGGELLFRGKLAGVLSGQHRHSDTVVIRFPDLDAARSWYSSPAYQQLVPLRQQAADVDLLTVQT